MGNHIYTIGHSTRTLEEFVEILHQYGIGILVDVRRFPKSGRNPQFNEEKLAEELPKQGVEYVWLGDLLGGYRDGGYESYMDTEAFDAGLGRLLEIARRGLTDGDLSAQVGKVALMCAEMLFFKCHRRFIADRLVEMGYAVTHILDGNRVYEHKRTEGEREE